MCKMVKYLLTIIVPIYKIEELFLRRCIESLISQSENGYKIILVDDGSPDNCGVICDEYAQKTSIITVIHQKNQGVSIARNNGIKQTETKWLTFVDADDWVESDYISTLYKILGNEELNVDVVMYDYVREFKGSSVRESFSAQSGMIENTDLEVCRRSTFYKLIQNGKLNPYSVIALWNKAYKTNFLRDNDIWFIPEAKKGQDRLFNADVLNLTNHIYYINSMIYHYRCWENSRTNKFDLNIPQLTSVELGTLEGIMRKHKLQDKVDKYLKCRICTRLYTCMRLYFFHDKNRLPYREKINQVRSLIKKNPYKDALMMVDMNLLTIQERIFVWSLKANFYSLCYFLVRIKSAEFRKKIN